MNKKEIVALLQVLTSLPKSTHQVILVRYANRVCKQMGFINWVDAYRQLPTLIREDKKQRVRIKK